ncbi:hypothetical protein [uncultured Cutibacterium sp.]|uniref:hypothetical protein n=1 Tax=uncultured Cutibacterium sp. TaxID=1912223 RepID=UPI002805BA7B|nr:hypothetical protein [uncultured Cutibacterium sp.]MDU1580851.1 hypothetical protein [Cutibacterium granulosum]
MHEYKDHWTAEYMYQIRHICNQIDDLQVAIEKLQSDLDYDNPGGASKNLEESCLLLGVALEELYRVDRHVRRVIDAISGEA